MTISGYLRVILYYTMQDLYCSSHTQFFGSLQKGYTQRP